MTIRTYSPETLRSQDTALVMLNQRGATVRTDLGRDAQIAADTHQLHVIAADRPGTATLRPNQGWYLERNYTSAMGQLASKEIMPEVTALNIKQVILVGRSAGGLAVLVTALTKELPTVAVHAQEPIGWQYYSVAAGRAAYMEYSKREASMINDPTLERLIRAEPTDQTGFNALKRRAAIIANANVDVANNHGVWTSPRSRTAAFTIASLMPTVGLDLHFAEYSMALPEGVGNLEAELRQTRSAQAANLIRVETHPNTTHRSFDLRSFSNEQVGKTVDRVLKPA